MPGGSRGSKGLEAGIHPGPGRGEPTWGWPEGGLYRGPRGPADLACSSPRLSLWGWARRGCADTAQDDGGSQHSLVLLLWQLVTLGQACLCPTLGAL